MNTPLNLACYYGFTEIVKCFVKHPNIKINGIIYSTEIKEKAQFIDPMTPIINAVIRGHLEIVKVLCDEPDIELIPKGNVPQSNKFIFIHVTPYKIAKMLNKNEIVEYLEKVFKDKGITSFN